MSRRIRLFRSSDSSRVCGKLSVVDDGQVENDRTASPEVDDGYGGLVERRIRRAMKLGLFDHLTGAGRPLPRYPDELDPQWWARRKIEEIRREVDHGR